MTTGFTFGKYLPFHNGHRDLIDFGLSQCDQFFVIVCASQSEEIPIDTRASWIEQTYNDQDKKPRIVRFEYNEDELPNTSVSSKSVSKVWSEMFLRLLPKVDCLITSEPYGDFVAEFMGIRHKSFDLDRVRNKVSSTNIRKSPYQNWSFVPDAVKPFYQKKIVFSGTESTGKSSISKALTHHFIATLVEEAGREIIQNSNYISKAHLQKIALSHSNNIIEAQKKLAPLVFIDTDIHITQSYTMFEFGEYMEVSDEIYQVNQAHLHIYLTNDILYEQDGTRLSEADRNRLDKCHRTTLSAFHIDFIEVSGSWEERLKTCSELIARLIN